MAQQLASPIFNTGPNDKIAAVDVYKTQQQTGQVVNSVQNILRQYDPKLARSLSGFSSFDVQSIARAALNKTGLGGVGNQLLSRVMQLNPGIANTIRSMEGAVRTQFAAGMSYVGSGVSGVIGEAKGAIGGYVDTAKESLGGYVDSAKSTLNEYTDSAKDYVKDAAGNISVSYSGILADTQSSVSSVFGPNPINNFGQDTLGQLGSGTFGITDPKNFQCTIGDVTSPINFDNIFQTQQMGSLVNSITGKSSMVFKDVGAQVGMYSNTIKQCLDCEVSGSVKDIFSVIGDRQVLGIVSREILPDVVRYSSVDDLFNLSSNLSSGELLAATPGLLNIFSRTFGTDPKSKQYNTSYNNNQHIYTYGELLQAYNSTYPGWNSYVRKTEQGDEFAINISPLIGGSAKFQNVMKVGATNSLVKEEKPYLLAALIKPESVEQKLARQYPRTKFYFGATVSTVKDPRSLNNI